MPDLAFLDSFFEDRQHKTDSVFLIDRCNEAGSRETNRGRRGY